MGFRVRKSARALFFAALLTISVGISPVMANDQFNALNDIFFYQPGDTVCSPVGGELIGSDIAEQVYNFLITENFEINDSKPLNPAQAAGILGNLQAESSMNPAAINPSSGASGLAQWLGSRLTDLNTFAQSNRQDWKDVKLQLGFLKEEMNGKELSGLKRHGFADASTAREAAVIFVDAFERPHASERKPELRGDYAEEFFQKYSGIVSSGASSSSGYCPSGGPTGDFLDNDSFVSFSQCSDPSNGGGPWGTIMVSGTTACNVGCGPTAAAMVIRNLTGQNITPSDTVDFYMQRGFLSSVGSGPSAQRIIAENYGIRAESISPNDLTEAAFREIFNNGGLIILGGLGLEPFFLHIGHYVVVRGITPDGKFRISDSGRGKVGDYDIRQILASASKRPNNATAFYSN